MHCLSQIWDTYIFKIVLLNILNIIYSPGLFWGNQDHTLLMILNKNSSITCSPKNHLSYNDYTHFVHMMSQVFQMFLSDALPGLLQDFPEVCATRFLSQSLWSNTSKVRWVDRPIHYWQNYLLCLQLPSLDSSKLPLMLLKILKGLGPRLEIH